MNILFNTKSLLSMSVLILTTKSTMFETSIVNAVSGPNDRSSRSQWHHRPGPHHCLQEGVQQTHTDVDEEELYRASSQPQSQEDVEDAQVDEGLVTCQEPQTQSRLAKSLGSCLRGRRLEHVMRSEGWGEVHLGHASHKILAAIQTVDLPTELKGK